MTVVPHRLPTLTVGLIAVLLAVLTAAPTATGQSPQELRRDNEQLRARVADLERELGAALQEIARLRAELASLVASGGNGAATPPPADAPVTLDESTPNASPRALYRALTDRYEAAAAAMAAEGTEMEPGDRVHIRALQRWAARVESELRDSISWHVRIVESARADRGGWILRLQAVDPVTETPLGDPFDALLARGPASRLKSLAEHARLPDVLVLRGTLFPEVTINADRAEPGPFDKPRLIGPYAEFGLSVTARSIAPPEDAPAETADAASGS